MRLVGKLATLCTSAVLATACIPQHLQKYMNKSDPVVSGQHGPVASTPTAAPSQETAGTTKANSRPAIYAIGDNIFRFHINNNQVWDKAILVLMSNYNITTVDKDSGLLTTEWDTFRLNGRIYRNKVSMHFRRTAWDLVDVIVYNNVEILSTTNPSQENSGVWLPSAEIKQERQEIGRIVQNIAIELKQPKPDLPEEMVARSAP